jgi:hypothetical protein
MFPTKSYLAFAFGLGLLFASGPPARATALVWQFQNVTLQDGATVTGSFIFDAEGTSCCGIGNLEGGQITVSDGSVSTGAVYTVGCCGLDHSSPTDSWRFYLYKYYLNNIEQSIGIFLSAEPTDAGGTIPLNLFFERRDNYNTNQSYFFVSTNGGTPGSIVSMGEAAVPEPATGLCFPIAAALLLAPRSIRAGLLRRRL